MTEADLFDVIELLVDLPEYNLRAGNQGAIVECYNDDQYEVEFTNSDGESLALLTLDSRHFIVVWKANKKNWLPVSQRVADITIHLSEERQQEVLNFARFLAQK